MRPVFIHIPKTAGTSVREMMVKNYDEGEVFVDTFDNRLEMRDKLVANPRDFAQYHAFSGHIPLWAYQNFNPVDLYFFSFVRHPVERRVSYYDYCRTHNYAVVSEKAKEMTFREFIQWDKEVNAQCSYLSGVEGQKPEFFAVQEQLTKGGNLFIGTTDNLESGLAVLKNRFGWQMVELTRENISKEKTEISWEDAKFVQRIDDQDMHLYRWALANG